MNKKGRYTYVGAQPDILGSCKPIRIGDEVLLTPEEQENSHNKRLIAEGKLFAIPDKKTNTTAFKNTKKPVSSASVKKQASSNKDAVSKESEIHS